MLDHLGFARPLGVLCVVYNRGISFSPPLVYVWVAVEFAFDDALAGSKLSDDSEKKTDELAATLAVLTAAKSPDVFLSPTAVTVEGF
jgi:hypothetical protein